MFYTFLLHHKRFMFYYSKDHLLDTEDMFRKKSVKKQEYLTDDNSDFDYDDVCKEVRNYCKQETLDHIDKRIIKSVYSKKLSLRNEIQENNSKSCHLEKQIEI